MQTTTTRSIHPLGESALRQRRAHHVGWVVAATAAAALAACGGGGSDAPATPANQAPSVTLDAPAANTNYLSTDTVNITATAADADGTVAKVEFLSDGVKIGEDTSAPFTFDWVNPPVGPHTLTVRAIDNTGASTVSASRTISSALNQVPAVAMAAPANNFKANAPTAVLLSANASDTDGTVAKVEFFNINPAAPVFDATTLVGEAAAVGAPPAYQFTTAALAAGTYNFAARATDNKGDSATSGSVQVIMNALPVVSISSPAPGANIIPGSNVTLRALASDADGSISKVEFFLNGSATPLGQAARVGATSEYTLAWTSTLQGAYSFTARATDNDDAQTTTGSVAVNVLANVLPSVTLDDPVAGTNAPTTLNLSASAADGDGNVTGVEFSYALNGGAATKANGTLAAGKWTLAVPVGAAQFGIYAVTATVTDNLGGKTTSPSKSKTIAANVPPTVNVTSSAAVTLPAGNAPTPVALAASASDTDGIARVEFFNGAAKVGEDTTAPYQFNWAGVAAGSYTITAKATDTVGSTTTSTAQTLVVTPNIEGLWSTLNDTQKAGLTLTPSLAMGTDAGVEAGAVLTAIGVNTAAPKFVVAMSQALRKLADLPLTPNTTYVACPGGGRTMMQPKAGTTDEFFVNYRGAVDGDTSTGCKIDGFEFYGGANELTYPQLKTVAPVPPATLPTTVTLQIPSIAMYKDLGGGSFRIVVEGVRVSGNGTPYGIQLPADPLETFPHNAYGYAYVQCTVTGGTKRCFTNHENSFFWAHDLAWTGWSDNGTAHPAIDWNTYLTDDPYLLNGTVRQCEADPQPENRSPEFCQTPGTAPAGFHIKFDGMTNVGGRAILYANNGWAVVTRLTPEVPGIERVTVKRTYVSGGTSDVAPLTYRCPVNGNGFFVCALVP